MADIVPTGLPFKEAIDHFRQKINLPTKSFSDLWQGQHARAFVVAGAQTNELLSDFRGAIDKAMASGTGFKEFRKDFDKIVTTHGWSHNGSPGWRSRVIYETNMRTAYAAGRYKQMTDPQTVKLRPFWQYVHGDSVHPRPLHASWDGIVLPADDPWWSTHFPPNGWGCKCSIKAINQRQLERLGKSEPDTAPENGVEVHDVPGRGEVTVPAGIDPGFDYNVGQADVGKQLANEVMEQFRAQKADAWELLDSGDAESNARPAEIPTEKTTITRGPSVKSTAELEAAVEKTIGDKEKVFELDNGGFKQPVNVNAAVLAQHIDKARAPYVPFLTEVLENPFEVWAAFERHKGTGQVVLRYRYIKAIETGRDEGLLLVAQALKGQLEAWTFIPVRRAEYLQKQRRGKLVFAR